MTNPTARTNWSYMTHYPVQIGRWLSRGRGAGLLAPSVTPHLDLIIRKNEQTRQFDLIARTHNGGDRVLCSEARQVDAKRQADRYATIAHRDYVEAHNARQEAHFAGGMSEATREGRREFERVVTASGYAEAVARAEALAYQVAAARDVVEADLADAEAEIRAAAEVEAEDPEDVYPLVRRAVAGDAEALAEVADLARAVGIESRNGGWIYLPGARTPAVRGWAEFAEFVADALTGRARQVAADMAEARLARTAADREAGALLDAVAGDPAPVEIRDLPAVGDLVEFAPGGGFEDGDVWVIEGLHSDTTRGTESASIRLIYRVSGLGYGTTRTSVSLARLYRIENVTEAEARAAYRCLVHAGRERGDVAALYQDGLYAVAKRVADRFVAEQQADAERAEAEEIDAAVNLLRDRAAHLLAPAIRPVTPSDHANALGGTLARVLTGAADYRQPLTAFERAAGVQPVRDLDTWPKRDGWVMAVLGDGKIEGTTGRGKTSVCLRVDGVHVGHMAATGAECRDVPADAE